MRFFMCRALDTGPADSLIRLQREAERLYAIFPSVPCAYVKVVKTPIP